MIRFILGMLTMLLIIMVVSHGPVDTAKIVIDDYNAIVDYAQQKSKD